MVTVCKTSIRQGGIIMSGIVNRTWKQCDLYRGMSGILALISVLALLVAGATEAGAFTPNASLMLFRYIANTGEEYLLSPRSIIDDVPSFKRLYQTAIATAKRRAQRQQRLALRAWWVHMGMGRTRGRQR